MNKVYVVMKHEEETPLCDGQSIVRVFLDELEAERFVDTAEAEDDPLSDTYYHIETHEVL